MSSKVEPKKELKRVCRYCLEEIKPLAKVCCHCERHQSKVINYLQVVVSFTALIMVLVGVAQVFVNYMQMDEAKKQRVEAEVVLKEAHKVLVKAYEDSDKIKRQAANVLSNAKASTDSALKASDKALSNANSASVLATATAKSAEYKVNKAVAYVDSSITASKNRVTEAENSFADRFDKTSKNIEGIRSDFSSELQILKARNRLTALADKAIADSDRKSYNDLVSMLDKNIPGIKNDEIISEILRIKGFYVNGRRFQIPKENKSSTQELIQTLSGHKNRVTRATAAFLLGQRNEKIVPDALVAALKGDPSLDVVSECISSFEQVTKYKHYNHLVIDGLVEWWKQNREITLSGLK